MPSIYDLADLAVSRFGLKGIDWAALKAKGRGSVWDRDYITNYMLPAQLVMIAEVGGMTFDVGGDPVASQKSYSLNTDILSSLVGSIMPLANLPNLGIMTLEVGLSREAVRYVVSHAYQAANYGLLLHADETIQHSGMSDSEIAAHADTCVGTMNALVAMRHLGLFRALGIDESQGQSASSGLGIAPALLIAAVVVAIAALAMMAWVLVSLVDLTKKNAIVAKVCAQAQSSGDAATTQQCVNTLTDPNKNAGTQIPNAIKAALVSLMPYALGGIAVYALYLSMPYLVKNLFTKRASA